MENTFTSLPDEAFLIIASFAIPPDVYNVALTCKHFHQLPQQQQQQQQQHQQKAMVHPPPQPVVLATRMLRSSLLSNLSSVLVTSQYSTTTLEHIMDLAEINYDDDPKNISSSPHVLLAGPAMVQACLGTSSTNPKSRIDLHLYSSAKAAPKVRSWLVEKPKAIFFGFRDHDLKWELGAQGQARYTYTIDTKIHHVEKFWSQKEKLPYPNLGKVNGVLGPETQEYFDSVVNRSWDRKLEPLGLDTTDPDFQIKAAEGGDFVYQIHGPRYGYPHENQYNNINKEGWQDTHLIVANKAHIKEGEEEDVPLPPTKKAKNDETCITTAASSPTTGGLASEYVMPLEVLEDFDLNIYKASFDGRTFRIPDPHMTFQGKTKMEPMRKTIVESYLRHHAPRAKDLDIGYLYSDETFHNAVVAIRDILLAIRDDPSKSFQVWTKDNLDSSSSSLPEASASETVLAAHGIPILADRPPYFRLVNHSIDSFGIYGDVSLDDDDDVNENWEPYVQLHNWIARMVTCNTGNQDLCGFNVVDAPFMTIPIPIKTVHYIFDNGFVFTDPHPN